MTLDLARPLFADEADMLLAVNANYLRGWYWTILYSGRSFITGMRDQRVHCLLMLAMPGIDSWQRG